MSIANIWKFTTNAAFASYWRIASAAETLNDNNKSSLKTLPHYGIVQQITENTLCVLSKLIPFHRVYTALRTQLHISPKLNLIN